MKINQKEKDMRREKILDVAFRLFVDQKIESVTMGEIAKEAGISLFSREVGISYCGQYQKMERLFR